MYICNYADSISKFISKLILLVLRELSSPWSQCQNGEISYVFIVPFQAYARCLLICPNAKENYQNKSKTLNEIANAVFWCSFLVFDSQDDTAVIGKLKVTVEALHALHSVYEECKDD